MELNTTDHDLNGIGISAGTAAIMQDLLYRHPLFEGIGFTRVSSLQVLIVGDGPEAFAFLDNALQAGQVPETGITICLAAADPAAARKAWLADRPAMPFFADIDPEKGEGLKNSCGLVRFLKRPDFPEGSPLASEASLQILLDSARPAETFHYIFVCLETDALTRAAAEAFLPLADPSSVLVCGARDQSFFGDLKGVIPVSLQEKISTLAEESRLFEMGFNTHLSYVLTDNLDIAREKAAYEDSYNQGASLSSALSIRYKLWSLRIDDSDPAAAAAAFEERLQEDEDGTLLEALGAAEHRRWVLEKAADGWIWPGFPDQEADYDHFLDLRDSKDKFLKQHICLVPGTAPMLLQTDRYQEDDRARWNKGGEDKDLDPLDLVSLRWHRAHVKRADLVRQLRPLDSSPIQTISDLVLVGSMPPYISSDQYETAVDKILQQTSQALVNRLLVDLKGEADTLLAHARVLPASSQAVLRDLTEKIQKILAPRPQNSGKKGARNKTFSNQAFVSDRQRHQLDVNLRLIRRILKEEASSLRDQREAWDSFYGALRQILEGSVTYALDYDHYESILLDSFESRDPFDRQILRENLDQIRWTFYPLIGAALYRDFKVTDTELVRHIPYILTNMPAPSIMMPFYDGRTPRLATDQLFLNLEASILVHPARITFLYYFDQTSRVELLIDRIQTILSFIKKRHMRCGISFVIIPDHSSRIVLPVLKDWFDYFTDHRLLADARILEPVKDTASAMDAFLAEAAEKKISVFNYTGSLFNSAADDALFMQKLREEIPGIRFAQADPISGGFKEGSHYSFRFLKTADRSFLRIREIMAMCHAEIKELHFPEFEQEYRDLWQIFKEDVPAWHTLCYRISTQLNSRRKTMEENSYCRFNAMKPGARLAEEPAVYYLPYYAFPTLLKMLGELRGINAIGPDSRVVPLGGTVCRVEVWLPKGSEDQKLDSLFQDPTRLADIDDWTIFTLDNSVYIYSAITDIRDLEVEKSNANLISLIQKLADKNYLLTPKGSVVRNGKASFSFPSPRFRELFSHAGQILELFVYYEVLHTGLFDEVATGLTFTWDDSKKTKGQEGASEVDLIAVRGRTTLIVECKATESINTAFYHRLDTLSRYGIHTKLALIHYNYANSDPRITFDNQTIKDRGWELDIRTFDQSDGMDNIGMLLADLTEPDEE